MHVEADVHAGTALVVARVQGFHPQRWTRALQSASPIFARSIFVAADATPLGERDRLAPFMDAACALLPQMHPHMRPAEPTRGAGQAPEAPPAAFSAVWFETPDTNDGKMLGALGRRLQPLLEDALRNAHMLDAASATSPRLHVLLAARELAYVGVSEVETGSRWPMGIPRVRMPREAPSRSALKLAEAFMTFLGKRETDLLKPGMRAVDLGAAPGGWTWQLAYRGLRVTAVDNGPLKGEVAQDALVTHLRQDGYAYRPRRPVDWMVCDIIDKPSRVAELVARWIATGDARRTIFNLKLPMKRRYEAVTSGIATIEEALRRTSFEHVLRIRQLYHDREEVTGYLERLG